jgi:hypothetical protein
MKPAQLAARINGISTPWGGVSWVPTIPDRDVAFKLITFVEARRVLFSTYSDEKPDECVQSVLAIRDFLTETISQGYMADRLSEPLRAARRYCLSFLTRVGSTEDDVPLEHRDRHLYRDGHWHMHDFYFGQALGELRAGVCLQVAMIAVAYDLDVEDQLADALPELDH